MVAVAVAAGAPSCKRPAEAAKDTLGEAGYQHTPEDWLRAVREDNVAVMKRFLAGGFAIDTRDAGGDSALHAAAASGARQAAEFLLNKGLPVDQRGAGGRTPLMAAVAANQPKMVRWLLRQGASPKLKDEAGYTPLMIAVRENAVSVVGELATATRDELDTALLAAALEGRAEMIDALTKYGASVYARMEDGRTPLMLAAQNGHDTAVKMLLDLGCGRFATTPDGKTAADLAQAEGHQSAVALITAKPVADELVLETPEALAREMATSVDAVTAGETAAAEPNEQIDPTAVSGEIISAGRREPVTPIEGRTLAATAKTHGPAAAPAVTNPDQPSQAPVGVNLVMRQYRQREIPLSVRSVDGETATLRVAGAAPAEYQVRRGSAVPGSRLVVVAVRHKTVTPKDESEPRELAVVELKDAATGASREILSGVPSGAHDPVALVEDARTGRRYTAAPGQRFADSAGNSYRVADVRPNQIVVEDLTSGTVQTLPLRGPRG